MSDSNQALTPLVLELVRCLENHERSTTVVHELAARESSFWGENIDRLIAALRAGHEPLWARVLAWFRMQQFRRVPNLGAGEGDDLFIRLLMVSPFATQPKEVLEEALTHAHLAIMFKHLFGGE